MYFVPTQVEHVSFMGDHKHPGNPDYERLCVLPWMCL